MTTPVDARQAKLQALREQARRKQPAPAQDAPRSLTEAVSSDTFTKPVTVESFITEMGLERDA